MFICQAITQLQERYGDNGYNDIVTNSAFQIILSQNNPKTSSMLSDSLGKGKNIIFTTINKETTTKEEDYLLFTSSKIGSLNGEQIVRVQNRSDRPLLLYQPFWFMYTEFYNQMSGSKISLKNKILLNIAGLVIFTGLLPLLFLIALNKMGKNSNKYHYKK